MDTAAARKIVSEEEGAPDSATSSPSESGIRPIDRLREDHVHEERERIQTLLSDFIRIGPFDIFFAIDKKKDAIWTLRHMEAAIIQSPPLSAAEKHRVMEYLRRVAQDFRDDEAVERAIRSTAKCLQPGQASTFEPPQTSLDDLALIFLAKKTGDKVDRFELAKALGITKQSEVSLLLQRLKENHVLLNSGVIDRDALLRALPKKTPTYTPFPPDAKQATSKTPINFEAAIASLQEEARIINEQTAASSAADDAQAA